MHSSTDRWNDKEIPYSVLIGKVIDRIEGMEQGSDQIDIHFKDGSAVRMYHEQDCCESVAVEDVEGDPKDHIGATLRVFEESTNTGDPKPDKYSESWTWTFYRLATDRGWITIRWLGESNGYYGESIDVVYTASKATS